MPAGPQIRALNAATGFFEWVKSIGGALFSLDPASAPDGAVTSYEDFTLASAPTALFTGQAHTHIDLTVGQFANVGVVDQYAIVFLVFNSSDPTTDLNNPAVRMKLLVQKGLGQTRRKTFTDGTLTSCHYKCANTSADLVLFAECK